MATIHVNGMRVEVPDGASVSVQGGVVFVNGLSWDGGVLSGPEVHFKVEGDIDSLKVDRGDVTVTGSVGGDVECGGSATVGGEVGGSVDAGGSVACGDVKGGVDAGGSVRCGKVGGDVDAGGGVRRG